MDEHAERKRLFDEAMASVKVTNEISQKFKEKQAEIKKQKECEKVQIPKKNKLILNLSKLFSPSFYQKKSAKKMLIDELVNDFIKNGLPKSETELSERLSKLNSQYQLDEVMSDLPAAYQAAFVKDIIQNGVPIQELQHIGTIIIYLHLDGIIYETDQIIYQIRQEILNGYFYDETLAKINELEPYRTCPVLDTKEDIRSCELNDLVPYYILQKKFGALAPKKIDEAKQWLNSHKNRLPSTSEFSGSGYYMSSAWLEGEIPQHIKPQWQKTILENNNIYLFAENFIDEHISTRTLKHILNAPRQELQESFEWWSVILNVFLSPKYRVYKFNDDEEYKEIILKVGEYCMQFLPNTKDNKTSNSLKGRGLAQYVNFLIVENMLEKALYVCESCIELWITDGTTTGFRGKEKKIRNKIAKLMPKQKKVRQLDLDKKNSTNTGIKGGNGVLNDEQILEVVSRYLSLSRQDRQLLPEEYGITRTNMYYLVSKNKHLVAISDEKTSK